MLTDPSAPNARQAGVDMGVVAYRQAHPEPRPLSFALRSRAERLGIEVLPHERLGEG